MKNKIINTSRAPQPIGAYNQAIISNGFVFTAGQVPIDPNTGNLIKGNFKERVRRVMNNLKSILEESFRSHDVKSKDLVNAKDESDVPTFIAEYEEKI